MPCVTWLGAKSQRSKREMRQLVQNKFCRVTRLQRFAWFRRKQELHFVHHRHANGNFAVIHFFWDRILATYRRPDAGQTQTNGTLRLGCAFSKLHRSEESW